MFATVTSYGMFGRQHGGTVTAMHETTGGRDRAQIEAGRSPAEGAQHSVRLTTADGMCTTAFSAMDDSIVDEAMLKTQQTEMAHLHKGQAESHEKLLHSFCIGGGGTAADGASVTKLVITRETQRFRRSSASCRPTRSASS